MALKNQKVNNMITEDKQSMTKMLNEMGEQMFVCKFGL